MKTREEALQSLKESFNEHYSSTLMESNEQEQYISLDDFFQLWHDEITRQYKELNNERSSKQSSN